MSNALATPRKIANSHKVFKVFKNLSLGMSLEEACTQAHTTPTVYRKWVVDNPESVQVMQKTISALERTALMEITHAADIMLHRIIALANNPELPPRTQLEVHSYLNRMVGDFEIKHGTTAREDIGAKEFLLKGPTTKRAEPTNTTTINIKPLQDGSVDVTVMKAADIIDGMIQDSDSQP